MAQKDTWLMSLVLSGAYMYQSFYFMEYGVSGQMYGQMYGHSQHERRHKSVAELFLKVVMARESINRSRFSNHVSYIYHIYYYIPK